MSTSRSLHRKIDSDLVAQIEANGKVRRRTKAKSTIAQKFRRQRIRETKPEVKLRTLCPTRIRKNQKRTEYFA